MAARRTSWTRLVSRARKRLKAYDHAGAEADLREALKLAGDFAAKDPRRPETCLELADCLSEALGARFDEADALYARAVEGYEASRGPRDVAVAKALLAWADAGVMAKKDLRRARKRLERAVEILEAAPDVEAKDLWAGRRTLGGFLHYQLKDGVAAIPLVRGAVDLAPRLAGLDAFEAGELQDDANLLARLLSEHGTFEEAREARRGCSAMAEARGEKDPRAAKEALHEEAEFLLEHGLFEEAETRCLRALVWDLRVQRKERRFVDDLSAGMDRLSPRGRAAAESTFRSLVQALSPGEPAAWPDLLAASGPERPSWVILNTLWRILAGAGRPELAERVLDSTLSLVRAEYGDANLTDAELLREKGLLRAEAGDAEAAERGLMEAVEITGKVAEGYPPGLYDHLHCLLALGRFLAGQGRAADARDVVNRARSAARKLPERDPEIERRIRDLREEAS